MTAAYTTIAPATPTLTADELLAELAENTGTRIVTIVTRTDPRLRKTGNPYAGNVVKVQALNGVLNYDYEAAVNRQRGREDKADDFQACARQWGERVAGTPVVMHKGKSYLSVKVERCIWRRFETIDTGEMIDPAELDPFMPAKCGSRQGVDREVIERTIALDSIVSIRMNGQTRRLVH